MAACECKRIGLRRYPEEKSVGVAFQPSILVPAQDFSSVALVATENNREYLPEDYGVDAFSKVTTEFDTSSLPKVKVSAINIDNNTLDEKGEWDGRFVDVSNVTSLATFGNANNATRINIKGWDISNVTTLDRFMSACGRNTTSGVELIGIEDLDTRNVADFYNIFVNAKISHVLDLSKWSTQKMSRVLYMFSGMICNYVNLENWGFNKIDVFFHNSNVPKINLINTTVADNATIASFSATSTKTFVGDYTLEDVISKNLYIFKGIKKSYTINAHAKVYVDRASLRALINGLAELTEEDSQTLTIGSHNIGKLTEEDIAIATNKNWTII